MKRSIVVCPCACKANRVPRSTKSTACNAPTLEPTLFAGEGYGGGYRIEAKQECEGSYSLTPRKFRGRVLIRVVSPSGDIITDWQVLLPWTKNLAAINAFSYRVESYQSAVNEWLLTR